MLAFAVGALWASAQPVLFLRCRSQRPLRLMVTSLVPAIATYSLAYLITPRNVGFLPERFTETTVYLGVFDGALLLVLVGSLFALFYYSVTRSITLRILTALERAPMRSLTVEQIENVCGAHSPFIAEWRLEALLAHRFLYRREGRYFLRFTGRMAAIVSRCARCVLRLRP
jgi:hypothetical protein